MKAFKNLCASIGRAFKKKVAQVKVAVAEHNEPPVLMRSVTDPQHIYICSGAPIPLRFANQRQRRKLQRQTR